MAKIQKPLKYGLVFSLSYIATEGTLLLLERQVSGWGRSAHRVIEALVNFWDRDICRHLLDSHWVGALARWIFDNSDLGIAAISSILRLIAYIIIGGTIYFFLGFLVGAIIAKKVPPSAGNKALDESTGIDNGKTDSPKR